MTFLGLKYFKNILQNLFKLFKWTNLGHLKAYTWYISIWADRDHINENHTVESVLLSLNNPLIYKILHFFKPHLPIFRIRTITHIYKKKTLHQYKIVTVLYIVRSFNLLCVYTCLCLFLCSRNLVDKNYILRMKPSHKQSHICAKWSIGWLTFEW